MLPLVPQFLRNLPPPFSAMAIKHRGDVFNILILIWTEKVGGEYKFEFGVSSCLLAPEETLKVLLNAWRLRLAGF